MKKGIVVPVLCFAVLSTPAFTKAVHAATTTTTSKNSNVTVSLTVTKYVNVNEGSSLLLRSKASTTGAILARLTKGTAVTVYSTSGGWSNVRVNGKTGYVRSLYLSSIKLPTSTIKYVNVDANSSLLLHQNASTSSAIVSKLKRGTSVKVISISGIWSKVTANKLTGYVHSQYLSSAKIASTGATISSTQSPQVITKYVNIDADSYLLLRQNASTSSAIVSKLKRGTSVKVISALGVWAKVTANGFTGYVHSEYLSSDKLFASTGVTVNNKPTAQPLTKYVNVSPDSSLLLRQNASTSSAILSKLKRGAIVKVISTLGDWAKVTANGLTGYVHSEYLSSAKITSTTATGSSIGHANGTSTASSNKTSSSSTTNRLYVNVSSGFSLNMRRSPAMNASIITQLSNGTMVQVISEANGWANVSANGKTGYVSSVYLSSTKSTSIQTTTNSSGNGRNTTSSGSEAIQMYVNVSPGSGLNMRTAPSTTASVMTQLAYGTIVQVISESNGWAQVSANGKTGYVSKQFLTSSLNNSNVDSVSKTFSSYSISLKDMESLELAVTPQTDHHYNTYIRSDALVVDNKTNPTKGVVFGSSWNIRGGAGTNFWVVGQVSAGDLLQIVSALKGTDGYTWYQISYNKTWVNASPDDVTYYLDPTNFENDSVQKYQFLKLNETANLDATEVNQKILAGKGILTGQAQSFITAGRTYGINELYLIAHALLETGNGTSELANGVTYNGRTVYNMYGIGAFDSSPVQSGAEFAYNAGWFTPEEAIIGGAQFIDCNYIEQGQDTLYKMRWNPNAAASTNSATHQYASDIAWASKQVTQIYNLYQLLSTYQINLDIPEYLNP